MLFVVSPWRRWDKHVLAPPLWHVIEHFICSPCHDPNLDWGSNPWLFPPTQTPQYFVFRVNTTEVLTFAQKRFIAREGNFQLLILLNPWFTLIKVICLDHIDLSVQSLSVMWRTTILLPFPLGKRRKVESLFCTPNRVLSLPIHLQFMYFLPLLLRITCLVRKPIL